MFQPAIIGAAEKKEPAGKKKPQEVKLAEAQSVPQKVQQGKMYGEIVKVHANTCVIEYVYLNKIFPFYTFYTMETSQFLPSL